jgi:hypothetical protein
MRVVLVEFDGEWYQARWLRSVPAGHRYEFLVDGTSTVIPHAEMHNRVKEMGCDLGESGPDASEVRRRTSHRRVLA